MARLPEMARRGIATQAAPPETAIWQPLPAGHTMIAGAGQANKCLV